MYATTQRKNEIDEVPVVRSFVFGPSRLKQRGPQRRHECFTQTQRGASTERLVCLMRAICAALVAKLAAADLSKP
jgi:hypothetical protein